MITIEQAEKLVWRRMLDGEPFEHVTNTCPADLPDQLPNGLQRLFARYRRMVWGTSRLDLGECKPYEWNDNYFTIGSVNEGYQLIVPQQEPVYVISDDEIPADGMESYPSVYHWILSDGLAEVWF